MAQYAFKLGAQDEFLCYATSAIDAQLKADQFVDREIGMLEPYRWIATAEANTFRMSVGA